MAQASDYGGLVHAAQTHRVDLLGTGLSVVCAVHCLSMPVVLSALPAAASVLGGFHPVLLLGVVVVALVAFVPGFRRHHSPLPLSLGAVGIALLTSALLFEESLFETVLSLAGALAMMAAHVANRARLRALAD